MTDPLIDTTVAHYHVLARLGGGGMGVVYKARDTKLGRLVALKFLPPEWSHDEDAKQRFVREAQAASATDHANICTIHDIQTTADGRLFIVMAFYDGQTLKARLASSGRLGVEEALRVATEVAEGLARAHAAGVVHRDIKPGNLILTEDAVKIVDFGLAKFADSLQLTQTGASVGTVAYMSPEQLRGQDATAASDVWAVGVVLYEMLAGHPPFQGGYAEALSYAIRHETPPLLRTIRPEVPEDVDHLVFRAMHKDPRVRFQTGRELARALRQLQGQTVPLDLLTVPVTVPQAVAAGGARTRRRRLTWVLAAGLAAVLSGVAAVAFWPETRTFVAIVPVANQTGDRTLEPYRLGLTLALTRELADSRRVRVWPYAQLLPSLRRFVLSGEDVSSREVVRVVGANSGAAIVVVPTLLYDSGAWRARAELQVPASGAAVERIETDPIDSSLSKDAASTLIAALAAKLEARFESGRWIRWRARPQPVRFQSLDAVKAFEEGINALEQSEYSAAREAFARASREDPRHPMPQAWLARVAQIAGDRSAAAQAADQAAARLEGAAPADRLLAEAVVAEARRQKDAESKYRGLAASARDEPAYLLELAAFLDRAGKTSEAIATYHDVMSRDGHLPGPYLELCRLYNSTRMNEAGQARSFGERAQHAYAGLGAPAGEAQALLCLADILRVGTPPERSQARMLATQALDIFERLRLPYGVARAQHYVASAARAQDDLPAAAASWERALVSARAVGNPILEGGVLINLGVTYNALANRSKALEYYRQSYELAERRGDERQAAYSRANAGALLIEFGADPGEGLRFVEGALRVVRRLEDTNFEVFCLQLVAAYYRFTGQYADAQREIDRAMAIARERQFADAVPSLLLDEGRVLTEQGAYVQARDTLTRALDAGGGADTADTHLALAQVQARLGDLDAARRALAQAQRAAGGSHGDVAPRLATAFGEVEYEAGRLLEARERFEAASRMWTDDLPDAATVEARAYLGLIDGLAGRPAGRSAIEASLRQAVRMRRPALEALCRVFLARVETRARRFAQAAWALEGVAMDRLGPELQAQVRFWRAQALRGQGDAAAAASSALEARQILEGLAAAVPFSSRARFLLRPDIRAMVN